jgi:hypothetical protein
MSQVVDRAIGRPVDDTFLGAMQSAGVMLGTALAGRVIGRIASSGFARLRTRLGYRAMPQVLQQPGVIRLVRSRSLNSEASNTFARLTNSRLILYVNELISDLGVGNLLSGGSRMIGRVLTDNELLLLSRKWGVEVLQTQLTNGQVWLTRGTSATRVPYFPANRFSPNEILLCTHTHSGRASIGNLLISEADIIQSTSYGGNVPLRIVAMQERGRATRAIGITFGAAELGALRGETVSARTFSARALTREKLLEELRALR